MVAQGKNDISFLRSTIVHAIVLYFFTQRDVCSRQHLNHTQGRKAASAERGLLITILPLSLHEVRVLVYHPSSKYACENEPAFEHGKQAHFTTITSSPLWHKLLQQCQTLLRRITPQNRTQGVNSHLTLAEIGAVADIPNVRLQLFDDLLRVRQLLR